MEDILRFCFINIATYCHNVVERNFDTPARRHFFRQIGGNLTAYPSILFTQISVFFYIITEIFAKFVRIFYHGLIVFALSMMQCRSSQQLHLQDYKSHTHAI